MITVIGQLASSQGFVRQVDLAGGVDLWALPAKNYQRKQPAALPVLMAHDETWRVGRVEHLERSQATGLLMVATLVADDLADLFDDGPWYLSAGVRTVPRGPTEWTAAALREVSLTRTPGSVGTRPLCWARHDITHDPGSQPRDLPLRWRDAWGRAHVAASGRRYRGASATMQILDMDPLVRRGTPVGRRAAVQEVAAKRGAVDALDGGVHRRVGFDPAYA